MPRRKCGLCGEPVLPGQLTRGRPLDPAFERHWKCHFDKLFGQPKPHPETHNGQR
jgi:hypothetical protein